jgi:hypothetical protein
MWTYDCLAGLYSRLENHEYWSSYSFVLEAIATQGTAAVYPNGGFVYDASRNATGPDLFTTVTDSAADGPILAPYLYLLTIRVEVGETVSGNLNPNVSGSAPQYSFACCRYPIKGTRLTWRNGVSLNIGWVIMSWASEVFRMTAGGGNRY